MGPKRRVQADRPRVVRPKSDRLSSASYTLPARPAGFLDRPRLVKMLQRGTDRLLTLVCAPAGAGKTTLVADWATGGTAPGPVVWLSLDDDAVQAGDPWSLVVEALTLAGVLGADHVLPSAGSPVDRSFLSALASDLAAQPDLVFLVLDCAGSLGRQDALGLDHLLRHSGGRLRLVLLTRSDPLLPLHQYRLADS